MTAPVGVGLTSMRDRVAAVAGELAVVSSPGKGTRVLGRIPLKVKPAPVVSPSKASAPPPA
jgi:signal transduction histidine kinase